MNTDVLLLVLRVVSGALLAAFLGAVFVVLWRDYRYAARAISETKRERGRLVVIQAGAEDGGLSVASDAGTAEYATGATHGGTASLVGASYALLPVTSLGRAPTNTIVLDEPFCSQEHALVTRRDAQWWLEDLQSSNGTLLNGEPVTAPVVVVAGDVISIGRVQLKVELD